MTLTELINNVYTLTNRPDLVNETRLAISEATLSAHKSDDYPRDIVEQPISFVQADYQIQFNYFDIFPLFKKVKYLRQITPASLTSTGQIALGHFLKYITPDMSLAQDIYGYDNTDVFYLAGLAIQIKNKTPQQYYLFGYYSLPDITDDGWNSWVSIIDPFVIIYRATASVFALIGQSDQANRYMQLYADQLKSFKAANLEAAGD